MARIQNLYQIYKLSSTFICENNLNIQNYTRKKAIADGQLVSVGDCILFDRIRAYRGDNRDYHEVFLENERLRSLMRTCKKENKIKESKILGQVLMKNLFLKDVITVEVKRKGEYRKLAKHGFYVNGVKYVRFFAGAGQIRRNCVGFIAEDLYEPLFKMLMCGLDGKIKEINIAKLSAYFALTASSILWVRTPRVCVIKDFETLIKDEKVDWIYKDVDGVGHVEERVMDFRLNSADGQGLIDPEFAAKWAKDMGLSYVPSSFVARSAFVKGNLVPFDFKEYAARHGISRIYDRWGFGYNIDEIDVLLSESQFKMYKYYSSWEEYNEYVKEAGIKWGVARFNREKDDEYIQANYQHLQLLDLTRDEIKEMIAPTVDWIQKICSGDPMYAMLFLFGGGFKEDDVSFQDVYSRAQTLATKAVVLDPAFLQDTYVQKKIYRNITEIINRAKIGKIWTMGNYSFMISDPIAQCRSALGLDPTGEVPADCVYSNFWNDHGVTGDILAARNPCIDVHELNTCTLYRSEEADYWYRYIKSGIIFSIYDTSTLRVEDADFDGDVTYSSNNLHILKGCHKKDTNIISYEKVVAPLHKVTQKNFIESDIRGFNSRVGIYSNYATVLQAMRSLFTRSEQEAQRKEIDKRKKLLREIVGGEIDAGKGTERPVVPWEFKHYVKVNPDDDDITKAEKYQHNSLVISKKPYFFRYLYPELNKKFKQFENAYNSISKSAFGIKFKKLLAKLNKTEEEMKLVRRYHKFSPLINSNCTMNILCREFEDVDFNIQYDKSCKSMLPTFEGEFECKEDVLFKIRDLYRKYSNKKSTTYISNYFAEGEPKEVHLVEDEVRELKFSIFDAVRDEIEEEYLELGLSPKEGLFYIGQLSKQYAKFNWAFAWDLLGNTILDCIERKTTLVPVEDEEGREYLGRRYVLKEFDWSHEEKEKEEIEYVERFED